MQVHYHSNAALSLQLLSLLESTAVKRGAPTRLMMVGSQVINMHTLQKKPVAESESVTQRFDDKARYSSLQPISLNPKVKY
jgi:hypothetical protein